MATVIQREVADKELLERAEQGDGDAFAALYQRHFQGLYDFALRIVRDDDLAADVVQSTFVKAWDAARKQKEVGNVKAWLYTIAHNLAIDELRMRKRLAEPSAGGRGEQGALGFSFAIADPSKFSDPEAVLQDRELVELVWDAASALNPQEYALLDLHLRRGLDADELSRHLSLAKSAVYTRLSRLRDSLEEAVTSTLLMRRGRRECIDLDWLLEELRATEATQPVRRAIKQHLEACERCQESKRRFVSPAEIFAGISLVPVTLELQSEIWESVTAHFGLGSAAAGTADGAGADAAIAGDAGVNGAGSEVIAPVDTGLSSAVGAKGVALSALATGTAVVVATTLVFTGGGERVEDPSDVHSISHAVGRPSANNVVKMAWSREQDADAYSVSWSRGSSLPDQAADLGGEATGAKSPALAPGRWYFNLRTRGDGDWTSTVHVGPFVIVREDAKPRRPSGRKHRMHAKTAKKRPTATTPVSATAVTGVAGVVATKQRPQESGGRTDEDATPPPSQPRSEPKAETTTPPQRSEPVRETTTPPPPPASAPLSPQPPPPLDEDEKEEADAEGDEKSQAKAPKQQQQQQEQQEQEQEQEEDEDEEEEHEEEEDEEEDQKPQEK